MMKKNGFTLAEVLITLAIIGVVATMTLPTLMNNAGEQQYKTGLKKGINTLTEAGQMNEAIAGYDYSTCTSDDDGTAEDSLDQTKYQSMYALLANRTSIDRARTGDAGGVGGAMKAAGNSETASTKFSVFFRDGSVLMYNLADTAADGVSKMQDDGLPLGFPAIFDINGPKGPNLVSNCQGEGMETKEDAETKTDEQGNVTLKDLDPISAESGALEDQCTKKQRVIKDRFYIQLRGSRAVPVGAASTWAFEN